MVRREKCRIVLLGCFCRLNDLTGSDGGVPTHEDVISCQGRVCVHKLSLQTCGKRDVWLFSSVSFCVTRPKPVLAEQSVSFGVWSCVEIPQDANWVRWRYFFVCLNPPKHLKRLVVSN